MKIKYIPIFTEDIERQVRFFADNLGFEVSDKKSIIASQECIVMQTTSPDIFILIVKDYGYGNRKCGIVISTDDCLNDYYNLKSAGVQFYNEPQYTPAGMRAEFADPSGNSFILIEERNYNNLS